MRYKVFIGILLSAWILVLFTPAVVLAEVDVEFNPLCWEEAECENARSEWFAISGGTAAEGWLEKEGECNKMGWGKCLAGQATKTSISFGGKKEFSNIGDYIKTIYNFGLVALSILAVVMIIVSGAQWISSAGNSEAISQSKKRIGGAVIGLFIAFMSYNILNSINPALVNLRLPQVYMLRAQVLPGELCRDMKPEQFFAFAAAGTNQTGDIQATGKETFNRAYPFKDSTSKEFWCGQRFFIKGASADASCRGDRCDPGQVCSDYEPVDKKNPWKCMKASIAGNITGLETGSVQGALGTNSWEQATNISGLYLVCHGDWGRTVGVDIEENITDEQNGKQSYVIRVDEEDLKEAIDECELSGVIGAYIEMEFEPNLSTNLSDENHAIGAQGVDLVYIDALYSPIEKMPLIWKDEVWIPLSAIQNGTQININAKNVHRAEQAFAGVSAAWSFFSNLKITDIESNVKNLNEGVLEMAKTMYGPYKPLLKPQYTKYLLWWEK